MPRWFRSGARRRRTGTRPPRGPAGASTGSRSRAARGSRGRSRSAGLCGVKTVWTSTAEPPRSSTASGSTATGDSKPGLQPLRGRGAAFEVDGAVLVLRCAAPGGPEDGRDISASWRRAGRSRLTADTADMADRSRSVAWLSDELILVLDLYMTGGGATTGAERDEVSALLRAIPVEARLADNPSFRSRAAVARKLGNFAAIDPNSGISGLPHLGRGDQQVWEEFAHDPARLQATAITA
jgi:hypothetical protein